MTIKKKRLSRKYLKKKGGEGGILENMGISAAEGLFGKDVKKEREREEREREEREREEREREKRKRETLVRFEDW